MFEFFANIFGYALNFIYNIVNNYGIAIIIFTIILKAIMIPMNLKQQKTMKKSAKIQVKSKEIQEKYGNDPVRMNQELMDLYKAENMSPFSGCLSSIIQFIVIISIFFVVSRPLTFMKHIDSDTINKYTQEITENNDNQRKNYMEIAIIREKAQQDENVNLNMNFLGLDLITSFISMKITSNMNGMNKKEENKVEQKTDDGKEEIAMEEMNKTMARMAPIMSVSISMIAPLGLALYWFVSNILMIIERAITSKYLKEE